MICLNLIVKYFFCKNKQSFIIFVAYLIVKKSKILINFKDRIKKGPVLFDGGIGTQIYNKGIFINKCYEELNLTNQNLITQLHQEYKNAGADVITTNTYSANRLKLESHNLGDKVYQINKKGAELAKSVADNSIYVAGSIGPIPTKIEPLGPMSIAEAEDIYLEQIQALIDGGVDLLIFETFVYPENLIAAINAARKITKLPIIAQMTIDEDGATLTGASSKVMIDDLQRTGADIIGANCTVGPQTMLSWLEDVRYYTKLPISVMPNAGKPKNIDGRNIYLTSPEYLGEYAKHFLNAGANIIGGCCGTTPEHISKMRATITALLPELKKFKVKITETKTLEHIDPIPLEKKSKLSYKIANNKFVRFVELLSPRGISAEKELLKAKEMNEFGIDVINIPDGPRASARMSAAALALQIQNKIKMETVLHFVCRDRNVIGMQSDLMGYYALGLKNILAITGDPPKLGNYPDATAVFDVDAIGLVNILSRLNNGMDIAGNPIGAPTGLSVGVGVNPGALDIEKEIDRLHWKVDAGAEYMVSQPVFDLKVFERFLEKTKNFKIPLVAGLWPLVSLRNAEFMNNEVPGVDVPLDIINRMKKYEGDKEGGLKEGIVIAKETLTKIGKEIAGIQISAPFGRVDIVKEILNDFKDL